MAALDSDESPAPTTELPAAVWPANEPSGPALAHEGDEEEQDYYDDEPTGRPVRKRFGPLSLILCALVIAGGAFYGGVRVEKSKASTSSASTGSLAALAARSAALAPGPPPAAPPAPPAPGVRAAAQPVGAGSGAAGPSAARSPWSTARTST